MVNIACMSVPVYQPAAGRGRQWCSSSKDCLSYTVFRDEKIPNIQDRSLLFTTFIHGGYKLGRIINYFISALQVQGSECIFIMDVRRII